MDLVAGDRNPARVPGRAAESLVGREPGDHREQAKPGEDAVPGDAAVGRAGRVLDVVVDDRAEHLVAAADRQDGLAVGRPALERAVQALAAEPAEVGDGGPGARHDD
jgi:hypothetical protein